MPDPNEPAPNKQTTGRLYRFKCWLTGVDPQLLAPCPPRDHDSVNAICLLQIAAWLWQAFIFSVVAHLMLAKPGEVRPELVVIAVLLASIIALVDSYMIIRSSWYLHGLEELRRSGLVLPGALALRLKNAAFLAFRVLLATMLVQLVAIFIGVLLFAKDEDRAIDAAFHLMNAPIFAAAEGRYGRDTTAMADEREKLAASTDQADKDASALRRDGTTPPAPDEEVASLRKRQERLEAGKRVADAALSRARAGARQGGEAATVRLQMAAGRAAGIGRDLSATRQHLQEAEARVERAAERHNNLVDQRLGQTEADRADHLKRLAELDAQLAERAANREVVIRAAVERDPALQPRDDGILARVHILARLSEDRHNLLLIILIDITFFSIELAAVLSKVFTFIPATYATELAKTEHLRAFETSRQIAERINVIGAPPPIAPALDELEPLAEADGTGDEEPEVDDNPPEPASGLDASLRQAARTAHARAAKAKAGSKQSQPQAESGANPDTAPRRPRGRPPGSGRLIEPPGDSLDFGENRPSDPPDGPNGE